MKAPSPWPDVCGTNRGYQRHRWRRVPTCYPCLDAHSAYERERRSRSVRVSRELMPCGSASAWRRHKRRGEQPCGPCCEAHRVEVAEYARKRRAA